MPIARSFGTSKCGTTKKRRHGRRLCCGTARVRVAARVFLARDCVRKLLDVRHETIRLLSHASTFARPHIDRKLSRPINPSTSLTESTAARGGGRASRAVLAPAQRRATFRSHHRADGSVRARSLTPIADGPSRRTAVADAYRRTGQVGTAWGSDFVTFR